MTDTVFKSSQAAETVAAEYQRVLARWPVPHTEREIETPSGKTFVVSCGPEDGPTVVLFHGSQANAAAWLPEAELWARKFRLHAIDMIGEPGFSARVRPVLDDDTHAVWLDAVFRALGLTRAALVGTSLGGWLALDYATRRPRFADALVLFCPAGIGRQKNFLARALPLILLGPWGARKVREMVFGPPPSVMPPALQAISPLMDMIGKTVKPRVLSIPRLTDADLAGLSVPVMVLLGARDALIDSFDTRARLQTHVPHAEICFLDDGYHFLPGHADRVMAFLERTLGTPLEIPSRPA